MLDCVTFPDASVKLLHLPCRLAAASALVCAGSSRAAETADVRMSFLVFQPAAPFSHEIAPAPKGDGLAGNRLAGRTTRSMPSVRRFSTASAPVVPPGRRCRTRVKAVSQ